MARYLAILFPLVALSIGLTSRLEPWAPLPAQAAASIPAAPAPASSLACPEPGKDSCGASFAAPALVFQQPVPPKQKDPPKPPTAKLPESISVGIGVAVKLESEFAGKSRWTLRDPAPQVQLLASDGGKSVIFCSPVGGQYVVICVGDGDGQEARCVVFVGGPAPPDPKPPGPDPLPGAPFVKLPEIVKATRGYVKLRPITNADMLIWVMLDDRADLDVSESTKTATFITFEKAGKFIVAVWAWKAGKEPPSEPVRCIIIIGDPGPDPKPPDPKPPGPDPDDPLFVKLKGAWSAETAADKLKIKSLAALYRQSVTTAAKPDILTCKALLDIMHAARLTLVGEALPAVRKVLTVEMDRLLPTSISAPLDGPTRDLCGKTFARIAALLEVLQ